RSRVNTRPLRSTLFPYTTLFRSGCSQGWTAGVRREKLGQARRRRLRPGGVGGDSEEVRGSNHASVLDAPIRAGWDAAGPGRRLRSEEHTSELQSQSNLVCRLLLE